MRNYSVETTIKLYGMLRYELSKKEPENKNNKWDNNYSCVQYDEIKKNHIKGYEKLISSDFVLTENNKTVEDLYNLYDSYVPKERRLFSFHTDADDFEGIFTIEELLNKLSEGYYENFRTSKS